MRRARNNKECERIPHLCTQARVSGQKTFVSFVCFLPLHSLIDLILSYPGHTFYLLPILLHFPQTKTPLHYVMNLEIVEIITQTYNILH